MERIVLLFVGLIFTYILSGLAIFLAARKVSQRSPINEVFLFLACLGLGPLTISWLLAALLILAPGFPREYYLAAISAIFTLLAIYGYTELSNLTKLMYSAFANFKKYVLFDPFALLGATLTFYFACTLVGETLSKSLTGNDALEYAQVARLFYKQMSAVNYPFVDSAKSFGYYGPWSHPPGYSALLTWCYMLQGSADFAGAIKTVAPMYMIYTVFLCYWIGAGHRLVGSITALGLLATPFYWQLVDMCHIDPIRLYAFLLVFLALHQYLNSPRSKIGLALSGYTLGMALFTHSIGILAIPIMLVVYFWFSREPWRIKVKSLSVIVGLGLVFALYQFIKNFQVFGHLIADVGAVPVYAVKELGYDEFMRLSRGLYTASQRWLSGVLKGFIKHQIFGWSYFILAIISALEIRRHLVRHSLKHTIYALREPTILKVMLSVLFLFYMMIISSVFLDIDAFIRNDRYMLTIQPFVVIAPAFFFSRWYESYLVQQAAIIAKISGLLSKLFKPLFRPFAMGKNILGVPIVLSIVFFYFYQNISDTTQSSNLLKMFQKVRLADDWRQLVKQDRYATIRLINRTVPDDAVILTFRQSDFSYYGQRKFISDINPLMIPFYKEQDKQRARQILRELGITHVHVPSYSEPTIFNSRLEDILGDPAYAELLSDRKGERLFRLGDNRPYTLVPIMNPWDAEVISNARTNSEVGSILIPNGFRKSAGLNFLNDDPLFFAEIWGQTPLTRSNSVIFYSGIGDLLTPPPQLTSQYGLANGQFLVQTTLQGQGLVKISIVGFRNRKMILTSLLWSGVIADRRNVQVQMGLSSYTNSTRLKVELESEGRVKISPLKFQRIVRKAH